MARQKDVALPTPPMWKRCIAVNAKSGITGIKDLNGKTIVTTTGTTRCRRCARTSAPMA